jgi:DnaK suppressor protein
VAHLTKQQRETLAKTLQERDRELRAEIRAQLLQSGEESHKDLAGLVADPGDESVANMLTDINIAAVARDVREIREIEAAQQRIADGTYGVCVDCGGEIGYARLQAYPTAQRCVVCQEKREKTYAQENHPTL